MAAVGFRFGFCFSRYLQKNKVAGPEGSIFLYELAERALDAKISDKIKEYILQVNSHLN